jgi:Leucine-rich repeat (LRR) protein
MEMFQEFPSINGLMIEDCKLSSVKNGFFTSQFGRIELVSLENDKIHLIESEAFQQFPGLRWLRLSWNRIQTLELQIFKFNRHLEYIDLEGNRITVIGQTLFNDLPNLKKLDLDGGNVCINEELGCLTCKITTEMLSSKLQTCYREITNLVEPDINTVVNETLAELKQNELQLKSELDSLKEIFHSSISNISNEVAMALEDNNKIEQRINNFTRHLKNIEVNLNSDIQTLQAQIKEKLEKQNDLTFESKLNTLRDQIQQMTLNLISIKIFSC